MYIDLFHISSKTVLNLKPYLRYCYRGEKLVAYKDPGWMVALRGRSSAANTTPLASLIFNWQRPQGGKPVLLSFSDLQLLFQKVS
jgi:Zn-dependent oligopeptidase